MVNPGSVILSGELMLRHMGWNEAAELILKGMDGAIGSKRVTYDFHRQMEGATKLKCSEFATEVGVQPGGGSGAGGLCRWVPRVCDHPVLFSHPLPGHCADEVERRGWRVLDISCGAAVRGTRLKPSHRSLEHNRHRRREKNEKCRSALSRGGGRQGWGWSCRRRFSSGGRFAPRAVPPTPPLVPPLVSWRGAPPSHAPHGGATAARRG